MPKRKSARNPWTTLKTRKIYENPWIDVQESEVVHPTGKRGIYGVVHFRNIAVGAMAVDKDLRVLLVGQFRYALNQYSWEIPEGGCSQKETTLAAAKRELKEETGYIARRWSRILTMHLSNSVTDEKAVVYLAQDLKSGASSPEDSEQLMIRWIPLTKALRMVEKGHITDAISVAAILRAARILL